MPPIWNKVQISDKAIQTAAQMNGISEEEAFDRLLELLENAHFAKFKGIDQGAELYRLENEYLYVKEQILVNYSRRKYYSKKLRRELHFAEDGRCEICGRPMDKQAVRVQRKDKTIFNDFNNYILLCPDCDEGRPDRLHAASFTKNTVVKYQEARNISFEDAQKELLATKNNLVLLKVKDKYKRFYWGPKLGIFILNSRTNTLRLFKINRSPAPVLEIRPQKRSRRWGCSNQEVAAAYEGIENSDGPQTNKIDL